MERRTQQITANVKATLAAHDVSEEIVAQAADLSTEEREQLTGTRPVELAVLAEVGGFLHVPIRTFLEGVA